MAEIIFTFPVDGTVVIEPRGYGGQLCKEVTKQYEAAVGGRAVSAPTSEAALEPIQVVAPQQQQHIGGG